MRSPSGHLVPGSLIGGYSEGLRKAEICKKKVPVLVNEDVGGLEIAMHDPTVVEVLECDNLKIVSEWLCE